MTPAEMELRIKRLEQVVLDAQFTNHLRAPICLNVTCGADHHPHWIAEPMISWENTIIYLP